MPEPAIRLPTEHDLDEWLRLRAALWPDLPAAGHRREMETLAVLDDRSTVYVAALDDGTLAGFVEVSLRDWAEGCVGSPVGYLEGWYVDERWRERGVGVALIAAAERWAVEQGCAEMASDTEVENVASQEVHRRLGYEPVGTLVHYAKDLPSGRSVG